VCLTFAPDSVFIGYRFFWPAGYPLNQNPVSGPILVSFYQNNLYNSIYLIGLQQWLKICRICGDFPDPIPVPYPPGYPAIKSGIRPDTGYKKMPDYPEVYPASQLSNKSPILLRL
jgi:hypothetical protein